MDEDEKVGRLREIVRKFNEDQPRDEHGRFAGGGGDEKEGSQADREALVDSHLKTAEAHGFQYAGGTGHGGQGPVANTFRHPAGHYLEVHGDGSWRLNDAYSGEKTGAGERSFNRAVENYGRYG